jgi:hypothetical protein
MQDVNNYKTFPKPLLWEDETTDEMKTLLTVVILIGYVTVQRVVIEVPSPYVKY